MSQPSFALLEFLADAGDKTVQSRLALGGVPPPSERERIKEMEQRLQTFEQAVQKAHLNNGATGQANHT